MTSSLALEKPSYHMNNIHPLILKLFNFTPNASDSSKTKIIAKQTLLQHIFTRYEINNNFAYYKLFLDRLEKLLSIGISSSASSEWSVLDDINIKDEWKLWHEIISETKQLLRGKYDDRPINSQEEKTNSKRVNCILQRRYKETKINQTGIMILYIATLMLPEKRLKTINVEKLTSLFKKSITFTDIFSLLPLDFSRLPKQNLIETQSICQNLIQKDLLKKNYKDFLRHIIDRSEVFITGNYTRPRGHLESNKLADKKETDQSESTGYRETKFYATPQDDEIPDEGAIIIYETEAGEEAIYGWEEPDRNNPEEINIPKEYSDAELKVGSKYWIQQYGESIAWNNNGINPFTLGILTKWIKDNNSSTALILSLLICIGHKTKPIMELIVGKDGSLTYEGEYKKRYIPPLKAFSPNTKQQKILIPTSDIIKIQLPAFVVKLIKKHINSDVGNIPLYEALGKSISDTEKDIKKVFKYLKPLGAKGLALDRIHVSLWKKISQITDDELIGYLITGSEEDAPPISSYYTRINQAQLQNIYNKAIDELFKC